MGVPYKFNRQELAGSLGDLGVVLPLGIAMILVNGLNPLGLFFSVGLFYLLSGMYYRIPVPVEPMKVIGAYAVATGITASEIMASSLLIGVLLLVIALTGAMTLIGKYTPKEVVRGVQLSTGLLLMAEGVRFMIGTSTFQKLQEAAEPYLVIQDIGPVPFGLVLGLVGGVVTLLLLDNKKLPAALVVVLGGMLVGLLLGTREGLSQVSPGFNLPEFMPFGFPSGVDFSFALLVLVLPQLPMTLGNAVIANVDLSRQYFGEAAHRATYKANCITMALANFFSFFVGGMPLCHGAGGLAAHYRFGARTPGSNVIIGAIFIFLAVLLGVNILGILYLIPMAVLGVLLVFAGSQLALTIMDLKERKEFFVVFTIVGITLATNLAAGFIVGIIVAYILKSEKLSI
ncbi:sulphate transporter [Desulfonatronospira thiodismutans ASO3-1]|uniref:Sulphate transporter n=2 Tax=Desulfonatronospira TaxID=488937 RepID=D6SS96_9BACT|nr:putative sulfate/molybdate transporter [Desulfonatronospira thiodismutans]EFI33562.1 sulphate transporter [Desulfonatronospira thiodismutans ASO3-1]